MEVWKMSNILLIGFNKEYIPNSQMDFNLINYYVDSYKNSKEHFLEMKRGIKGIDYCIINLLKKYLEFDESILINLVYSNSIPIYGIGDNIDNIILGEFLCRRFDFLQEALQHIQNIY